MPYRKQYKEQLFNYLPNTIFFLLTSLYFIFFTKHIFIYQEKYSLFIFSRNYLFDQLNQPGSLLKYIATFLTSFYYYPSVGAFIASTVILLSVISFSAILRLSSGKENYGLPVILGIIMFYLQANYQYMLFNNLGIMINAMLAVFFIKHPYKMLPVINLPLLYFILGGFTWMLYGIYIFWLLVSGLHKNILQIIFLIVAAFLVIIISGELLFFQSYFTLLVYPWSPGISFSDNIIFTVLGLLICILPLAARMRISFSSPEKSPAAKKQKSNMIYLHRQVANKIICNIGILKYYAVILLIVIGIFITSAFRYDITTERYFRAEKLFYEGKYNELINFNLKYTTRNI
ncbi:MAG: DUF6057 family protein, partial [Bacteroidales bacterium]